VPDLQRRPLPPAILIGAFAGLMPAVRASRMPPTVALRTV
jgi:putative ABC transport system permease protein